MCKIYNTIAKLNLMEMTRYISLIFENTMTNRVNFLHYFLHNLCVLWADSIYIHLHVSKYWAVRQTVCTDIIIAESIYYICIFDLYFPITSLIV